MPWQDRSVGHVLIRFFSAVIFCEIDMSTVIQEIATIQVAAGIVMNVQGLVLVALRPKHTELGGLWEFPGGKVESGESLEAALKRELAEEIGIEVIDAQSFLMLEHNYPNRKVILHVYKVEQFKGEPQGREGQELRWVTVAELSSLEFPAANHKIIEALK